MTNTFFPTGLIIDQPNLDLEVMHYYSYKWGIERDQIERGQFTASINAVHTPNIQLGSAFYSHGLMRKGSFPTGTVFLGFLVGKESSVFQNSRISSQELIVMCDGDELDILSNTKSGIFTIVIEKELFHSTFYNYFNRTLEELLKNKRFIIKADQLTCFAHGLSKWSNYLQGKAFIETNEKPYHVIESEILSYIFGSIVFESKDKKRDKFQAMRVRDLLHESLTDKIDITQMIKELNISERQLHESFKTTYGISPKKYLRSLRFNAIKNELLSADPHIQTISDIAFKYEFTHVSHFSHEYGKMFGELPSETFHKKKFKEELTISPLLMDLGG